MSRPALAIGIVAAIVVAGVALRVTNLGYSEFQGDEARAMLMASRMVDSRDPGVLLWHKKGPAEIVLPALTLALGRADELAARLPFALAGVAAMVLIGVLGWRLWGQVAGIVALLIAALDGYLIAFSRIVQYQSVVLVCSVAAVGLALAAYRRAQSPRVAAGPEHQGTNGTVALALTGVGAGALAGLGTWAHYEAVFAIPPALWLLAAAAWMGGPGGRVKRLAAGPGVALASFAVVASLFYIPFIAHPQFSETLSYIADRRVGGGLLHDNLADAFARASFYNPSFVVALLGSAVVAVLVVRMAEALPGRMGPVLAAIWVTGLVVATAMPARFTVPVSGAAVPAIGLWFGAGIAVLLLVRPLEVEWRAIVLWFALPFGAAAFLVTKPHTHFYTALPGVALLCGWGAMRLAGRLDRRTFTVAAGAVGVVAALAFLHQWVVFVRHTPEYKRVYPEARLPGFWTPFGDEPPRGGYFGFPYRAGWRAVQQWYETGEMAGSYDSNEESLITGWYTGGAARCADRPRYLIVVWRPQDAEAVPDNPEDLGYALRRVVTVGGQEKLWVYERDGAGEVERVAAESLPPPSAHAKLVMQALELPLGSAELAAAELAPDASIGGRSRGTSLEELRLVQAETGGRAAAGGSLSVALAWSVADFLPSASTYSPTKDWSTRVELRSADGDVVAASDHWPGCGEATSAWQHGTSGNDVHYDAHELPLPADLAPGDYEVWAGVHPPEGGALTAARIGSVTVQ